MEKQIELKGSMITFVRRYRPRSRSLGITIYRDGRIAVSSAKSIGESQVRRFIEGNGDWILRTLKKFEHNIVLRKYSAAELRALKPALLSRIRERIAHFNQFYGFSFEHVSVKNTSSRWGSCSRRGNLNFSYKLADLPQELFDYVIVHELCHLQEFNHAESFWTLVSRAMPDYHQLRDELKKYV